MSCSRTSPLLLLLFGGAVALALTSCKKDQAEVDPTANCGPPNDEPPAELACTGLYSDFRSKTVAPANRPYAPAVTLWSDGYEKSRFIALPDGSTIDTTTIDEWRFPVGTKVWKEFRFGSDRRIETRLLWKVKEDRWVQAAYVWSEDGSSATRGEGQELTVAGDVYKVPKDSECTDCHRGRKDKLLGVEAIALGLPAASGVTLAVLASENRLVPPPPKTTVAIDPGLGVLHMNCGVSCHNSTPGSKAFETTLRLRIGFDEATTKPVASWQLFSTTVGVPATLPGWNGGLRIAPGAPNKSVIISAMNARGTGQMPPATREVDFDGVAAIESWIRALPP